MKMWGMGRKIKHQGVYIAKATDDLWKVGISKDIDKRIKGLNHSSPHEISLYMMMYTDKPGATEAMILADLAPYHKKGEWVETTEEIILKTIKKYKDGPFYSIEEHPEWHDTYYFNKKGQEIELTAGVVGISHTGPLLLYAGYDMYYEENELPPEDIINIADMAISRWVALKKEQEKRLLP